VIWEVPSITIQGEKGGKVLSRADRCKGIGKRKFLNQMV